MTATCVTVRMSVISDFYTTKTFVFHSLVAHTLLYGMMLFMCQPVRHSLRVNNLNHTHSLASFPWSGLSDQRAFLLTENCVQYQKWYPYKEWFWRPFVLIVQPVLAKAVLYFPISRLPHPTFFGSTKLFKVKVDVLLIYLHTAINIALLSLHQNINQALGKACYGAVLMHSAAVFCQLVAS